MMILHMNLVMLIGHLFFSCNDVNITLNKFQDIFSKVCNSHAPLKKKRMRKKKSPWLNNDVINLMRERDKLKNKITKGGNNKDWSRYRKLISTPQKLQKKIV